jgi:peptidoglycan/xylan/chitin deacetylase (PgdA/CDA1 family)
MPPLIGLKVDVDTLEGYLQGIPSLLRQMEAAGVKATFFMSVGPDRSGVAVRRVFTQRGFISKMLRTRPLNKLSPNNMLYGTVLRAPIILDSDPGIVRAVHDAGHEVGVHAWDHIGWHDSVGRMPAQVIREQLSRAYDRLSEIIGQPVTSFAAPGWQCSVESLRYHDERGLLYASDTRGGAGAFLPRIGEHVFKTPQLPTNLLTLDEMWGLSAHSQAEVAQQWLAALDPQVNVLTIHTEMEGMALPGLLPEFVERASEVGAQFMPLRELITDAELPVREVFAGRLPGRAGKVWLVH